MPPGGVRGCLTIEQAIKVIDQPTDPGDRMTNCAQQPIRITEEGLEQQGDQRGILSHDR